MVPPNNVFIVVMRAFNGMFVMADDLGRARVDEVVSKPVTYFGRFQIFFQYPFTSADLVVVFIVAFDGEVCMIVAPLSNGVYLSIRRYVNSSARFSTVQILTKIQKAAF